MRTASKGWLLIALVLMHEGVMAKDLADITDTALSPSAPLALSAISTALLVGVLLQISYQDMVSSLSTIDNRGMCACNSDPKSGGVYVGVVGCGFHFGDGYRKTCYVTGGVGCMSNDLVHSKQYIGAAFRPCEDEGPKVQAPSNDISKLTTKQKIKRWVVSHFFPLLAIAVTILAIGLYGVLQNGVRRYAFSIPKSADPHLEYLRSTEWPCLNGATSCSSVSEIDRDMQLTGLSSYFKGVCSNRFAQVNAASSRGDSGAPFSPHTFDLEFDCSSGCDACSQPTAPVPVYIYGKVRNYSPYSTHPTYNDDRSNIVSNNTVVSINVADQNGFFNPENEIFLAGLNVNGGAAFQNGMFREFSTCSDRFALECTFGIDGTFGVPVIITPPSGTSMWPVLRIKVGHVGINRIYRVFMKDRFRGTSVLT